MENVFKRIQAICENATGNIYDIYFVLYKECLSDQPEPGIILQKILTEVQYQEFTDDGDARYISETDIEDTRNLYFELLRVYVRTLVRENLEETEFYQKLYDVVFQSGIFSRELKTQAILLCFLAENIPGIPYFQATNLLKMTSEDYKEAVQRLKPYVERAIDILNRHFKSRTEESSQIYEILSAINNREDKIVFLSVFTNIVQRNAALSVKEDKGE